MGRLVTIDAARPYTPTLINRNPTICGNKRLFLTMCNHNGLGSFNKIVTMYRIFNAIKAFFEHENPPHILFSCT